MYSILFVCLGNICRSPTAEGVFRAASDRAGVLAGLQIDSAGTAAWHVGKPPDKRAQAAALSRGVDLSQLQARRVTSADFAQFDLIVAMDANNRDDLEALRPNASQAEIRMMLDFAPDQPLRDVPDPYYGGPDGFEAVLDLIEAASAGLLAHLSSQGALRSNR